MLISDDPISPRPARPPRQPVIDKILGRRARGLQPLCIHYSKLILLITRSIFLAPVRTPFFIAHRIQYVRTVVYPINAHLPRSLRMPAHMREREREREEGRD